MILSYKFREREKITEETANLFLLKSTRAIFQTKTTACASSFYLHFRPMLVSRTVHSPISWCSREHFVNISTDFPYRCRLAYCWRALAFNVIHSWTSTSADLC